MGCQGTNCKVCGKRVPACQLVNGVCGTCRSKQVLETQKAERQKQEEEALKRKLGV